jgi:maltose-binding protein MalE
VAYNDLPQSYTDAVLAGGGPDIVLSASWWLGELVAAGVVQPLDDLIAPDELAVYWPATLDNLRHDGTLYGLPTHFELVSLYYNQALVAPDQFPATTEAWLALAQQNSAQGSGLYASLYHLYWGLPAYGAQLFDETGLVILDRTEGAAGFLTWLASMSKTPGTFVDPDYGMLLDRFKKGEYAFFVDGPWAIDELRGALGDNLGVTLLPAGPAAPAQPWLNADGIFLNPRSTADQQERALAFARFITSDASGEILARTARRLPANRNVNVDEDPLLQGFMQQAAQSQSMPALTEMENAWGYGGDMLLKVINDVGDPQSIVAETTTLINEANGK